MRIIVRVCLQSLEKCTNVSFKNIGNKNKFKMCINKRRIWHSFRIRWKCFKKFQQKKIFTKKLTNYLVCHLSVLWARALGPLNFSSNCFASFSTDSKTVLVYVYFDTQTEFFKTLKSNAHENYSKNQKNIFCKCVLEFNFTFINVRGASLGKFDNFFLANKKSVLQTDKLTDWQTDQVK